MKAIKSFFIASFHSISFPSEQGQFPLARGETNCFGFHSISFPSEQGRIFTISKPKPRIQFPFNQFPQRVGTEYVQIEGSITMGFHSISFPSEQGLSHKKTEDGLQLVSIQLVSLASRDNTYTGAIDYITEFPFNQFPQRVGTDFYKKPDIILYYEGFHSISFPSEQGHGIDE